MLGPHHHGSGAEADISSRWARVQKLETARSQKQKGSATDADPFFLASIVRTLRRILSFCKRRLPRRRNAHLNCTRNSKISVTSVISSDIRISETMASRAATHPQKFHF